MTQLARIGLTLVLFSTVMLLVSCDPIESGKSYSYSVNNGFLTIDVWLGDGPYSTTAIPVWNITKLEEMQSAAGNTYVRVHSSDTTSTDCYDTNLTLMFGHISQALQSIDSIPSETPLNRLSTLKSDADD